MRQEQGAERQGAWRGGQGTVTRSADHSEFRSLSAGSFALHSESDHAECTGPHFQSDRTVGADRDSQCDRTESKDLRDSVAQDRRPSPLGLPDSAPRGGVGGPHPTEREARKNQGSLTVNGIEIVEDPEWVGPPMFIPKGWVVKHGR